MIDAPPVTLSLVASERRLDVDDVFLVARSGAKVAMSDASRRAVGASQAAFQRRVERGDLVYGVSRGVGSLESAPVAGDDRASFPYNLLRSHAAGVGPPMRADQVRAMMLTRAHVLAQGRSAIAIATLEALVALLNAGVTPVVPEGGSVGASDLAPLAHMALVLIGEGEATIRAGDTRAIVPGDVALAQAGLVPVKLEGRDALALINGINQTVGIGTLVTADATRLLAVVELASAMALLATRSPDDFLDPRLAASKPHEHVIVSNDNIRRYLGVGGSRREISPQLRAHLSIRYAPQVFGATRRAVAWCKQAIDVELNAVVDNPIIDADGFATNNSGATSGQVLGESLDTLASSLTSVAVLAERTVAQLCDPHHSGGLPAFLIHQSAAPGLHSGLMMAQYTAASLVAELRMRSVPASVQSIPTGGNTEDHVSMSALSARRAAWCHDTVETVVAIALLAAAQAVDLSGVAIESPLMAAAHAQIRAHVPLQLGDRVLARDIAALVRLVRSGQLG